MAQQDTFDETVPRSTGNYQVGQRFVSGSHRLDAEQIKAFATQFDPQPFHLDDQAARGSSFGGLVASGWHTAAISMCLLVNSGIFLSKEVMGAGAEIRWLKPARAGDVLTVESEVIEVSLSRSKPGRGVIKLLIETKNQHNETVQIIIGKMVGTYVPQVPSEAFLAAKKKADKSPGE